MPHFAARCVCLGLMAWCSQSPLLAQTEAEPTEPDQTRPEIVVADFEGPDYGAWKTTGKAFGTGPAHGALPGQMPVEGFEGRGLVNSFLEGDGTTGTLTSPPFQLERKFLSFLIGGGKHPGQACINLIQDGKVVRTASGPNDRDGGSERLEWHTWEVTELTAKPVQLQIVDHVTGGWGHINIDHIVQSDRRRGNVLVQRQLEITTNFLHLPVKTGAPKRRVKLTVGEKTIREFEIELAEEPPTFTVACDVRAWKGQTATLSCLLPADSTLLQSITASNDFPGDLRDEAETKRPQFHFTSRRGWLNDPNGLVYFGGEWHLFYQHNPYGWNWGNMHWGHAVSPDLFHWQELPTALFPREWGDFAFSGSAIVDQHNHSGFQAGKEPPLLAFYTSTGRGECVAFSNDRGRTWEEYEGNPVVKHAGRDPKVIWHKPTAHWIMAVYDEPPNAERGIAFYRSKDLKHWNFTSRINGFFECPDLFALKVEGSSDSERWVLYGADGKYLLGQFDGLEFRPDFTQQQPIWFGNFYAAQTYSDAPDGRRVQIGWGNGITFPEMPFNQQMTVPVELTLRQTAAGLRMTAWPVQELSALADGQPFELPQPKLIESTEVLADKATTDLLDLSLEVSSQMATGWTLTVKGTPVTYDAVNGKLTCGAVTAPVASVDGRIALRILSDRNSLEIFANEGLAAISVAGGRVAGDDSIQLSAKDSAIQVTRFALQPLRSAAHLSK